MASSLTNVAETYTNPYWGKMIAVESVQELALNKPDDIPQRYIRPHDDRPSSTFSHDITTIPLIDMKKLLLPSESNERQQEMGTLSKACQDWGFFQVVNHGIPHSLIDRIRGVANEFFSLPLDEKQRYAPQAGDAQGYGKSFVVDEDQILDWSDLLDLAIMPQKLIKFTLWPTTPLDYRDTVERYRTEMERVAQVLLSLFAENLQLKSDYFKDKFGDDPMMTMGMNLYPPCPRPDLVLGLSPHSDGSGISLLLQDDQIEGLQVHKNNQWISVQPIPYAFVVNIGDLVEVMTNGRYKSIEHRAVTNKVKTRLSIAVFYYPGLDEEVAPASSLVDEEHPLLYRKFIHHGYMNYYLTKQLNGKHNLAFRRLTPHPRVKEEIIVQAGVYIYTFINPKHKKDNIRNGEDAGVRSPHLSISRLSTVSRNPMPKERNNHVFSSRKSRAHSPYQLNACPLDREVSHVNPSDAGRSLSKKDWEDALCPICMNPPHNAVLLLCSSHEKGCRTYMCDTSYRHSNCLDQFKKAHTLLGLIPTEQTSDVLDEISHPHSDSQNYSSAGEMTDTTLANEELFLDESFEPNAGADLNTHEISQLICPLCRGQVKGWTVVEQARKYLNTKFRSCSQESCLFEGAYGELRKHARLDHPLARPTEVDPDRQRDWQQLEQERNISDVISSIRSAMPGAMMLGDYVVEAGNASNEGNENYFAGDERNWWSFLLLVQFLDQNAHITISRAIPAQVRARRSGRFRRNFTSREGSSEAGVNAQGNVSGSNARHNDRFGRTFSLRVENSEAGANAQGNVSSSNASVRVTDVSTEWSSRSSSNVSSSSARVLTTDFSTETSSRSSSRRQSDDRGSE